MSPEWITAISSFATFLVIAASAIAAVVQLRHVRNSNQIVAFNDIRHHMESAEFERASRFIRDEVPVRMDDPSFRRTLLDAESHEWQTIASVCNFLDGAAAQLVKHGMVDAMLACDVWYAQVVRSWDSLAPLIATKRARLGYALWEDFEYLTIRCKQFRKNYPNGTFPKHMKRLPLPEPWQA
ncbi:MAG TPA: hypothetical protein VIO32_07800 [Candidatus Baltobacteraceae bacterium]